MSAFPSTGFGRPKPPPHYPYIYHRGDKSLTIVRCTCGYDTDPRGTDEEREAEVRAHVRMAESFASYVEAEQ